MLGPDAKPTPIQAFAMKAMIPLTGASSIGKDKDEGERRWSYFLLASETGSGKSFAYMLPVIQHLKETESRGLGETENPQPELPAPRALILAPTHELTRQLARFTKSLIHYEKLRVVCASRTNTTSKNAQVIFDGESEEGREGMPRRDERQVDVLACTPAKLLELAMGQGWNRVAGVDEGNRKRFVDTNAESDGAFTVGQPKLSLERVECVVIDEADVLFGMCTSLLFYI